MYLRSIFKKIKCTYTCVLRVHTHTYIHNNNKIYSVHSGTQHVRPHVEVEVMFINVQVCMYIHEGRDEAMASGGVILETKKQPETLLLKYSYSPPENNSSRRHGFIPTFTCTCMYVHT